MAKRVTLKATWMVTVMEHAEHLPFSSIEQFNAYAQDRLVRGLSHYKPELKVEVVDSYPGHMELALTWEVNLDMVAGMFHQPEDHADFLKVALHTDIRAFSNGVWDIEIDGVPYKGRRKEAKAA